LQTCCPLCVKIAPKFKSVHLAQLNLYNFKNIEEAQLRFRGGVVCLLGKNGSGKTTLLDAIYYLSFTKSAINTSDGQNVGKAQSQLIIKGQFENEGRHHEVICAYQSGQKKIIREDGQELIWEGSEMRRKFFDTLISQLDKRYLENLIIYTNCLKQRNSLLRTFSENGTVDYDLLTSYDQKIVPAGAYLSMKRKQFVDEFLPSFKKHYLLLVDGSAEEVHIQYKSDLVKYDFAELLNKNLQRDILLQRTSSGIHRDDFDFLINGSELKKFGSQGQQKSFLIALKLTEFQSIAEAKKFNPILLLDDIFDKLDEQRIRQLMILVSQGTFGQIFITDARPTRSIEILKEANVNAQMLNVDNGQFTEG
jgi:DNA replication and repair protein RecF